MCTALLFATVVLLGSCLHASASRPGNTGGRYPTGGALRSVKCAPGFSRVVAHSYLQGTSHTNACLHPWYTLALWYTI